MGNFFLSFWKQSYTCKSILFLRKKTNNFVLNTQQARYFNLGHTILFLDIMHYQIFQDKKLWFFWTKLVLQDCLLDLNWSLSHTTALSLLVILYFTFLSFFQQPISYLLLVDWSTLENLFDGQTQKVSLSLSLYFPSLSVEAFFIIDYFLFYSSCFCPFRCQLSMPLLKLCY